jgi:thiamine biosynthesis protein ThiS
MQISVNGETRSITSGTTIAQLLDELQMQARHVAVEVNLELVPRASHASRELKGGDKLEVVTLVGGG